MLLLPISDLRKIRCPSGWMTKEGYLQYLRATLAKMRKRQRQGAR